MIYVASLFIRIAASMPTIERSQVESWKSSGQLYLINTGKPVEVKKEKLDEIQALHYGYIQCLKEACNDEEKENHSFVIGRNGREYVISSVKNNTLDVLLQYLALPSDDKADLVLYGYDLEQAELYSFLKKGLTNLKVGVSTEDRPEKASVLFNNERLYFIEELDKNIVRYVLPALQDVTDQNYAYYDRTALPIVYLIYGNSQMRENFLKHEEFFKELRGQYVACLLDGVRYSGFTKEFKKTHDDLPLALIFDRNRRRFVDETKDVQNFVNEHKEGKLKVRSAEAPEKNDAPVKVVTADTYSAIVMDTTKDVFVKFYAPWCRFCIQLAPAYEELAKGLDAENVVVAEFNMETNDLPFSCTVDVPSFPTLYLIKADTNEVVKYSGDRTAEDMRKFLKENAVNGKEIVDKVTEEVTDL